MTSALLRFRNRRFQPRAFRFQPRDFSIAP
jgi:hypothetical protein